MKLKAKKREITGYKVKKLRRDGLLPGVIFGNKKESTNINLEYQNFVKAFSKAGETEIIDVEVEGEDKPRAVLINEVQIHPVKDRFLHVNFYEVDLSQKVHVAIPIEYIGEEDHPLIKNQKAILITSYDEIEVEALPRDLPPKFEVSIESLEEIGDVLTIADLKKNIDTSKVELVVEDDETVIANLTYAEMEEEEEEEAPMTVEDVEVPGEEDDEEEKEERKESQEKPSGGDTSKDSNEARGGAQRPDQQGEGPSQS